MVISPASIVELADGIAMEFTFHGSLFPKVEAHLSFWNLEGILTVQAFYPPLRETIPILIFLAFTSLSKWHRRKIDLSNHVITPSHEKRRRIRERSPHHNWGFSNDLIFDTVPFDSHLQKCFSPVHADTGTLDTPREFNSRRSNLSYCICIISDLRAQFMPNPLL
jgi:hypothetical protein